MNLHEDVKDLRDRFYNRYMSLSKLKGRTHQAQAAKRAYLDLNKLCKKHGLTDGS